MKEQHLTVPCDLVKQTGPEPKMISITTYTEKTDSKIYTEVKENLLVMVLKGKKKLRYNP